MTGYADFEEFVIARRAALLRTAYLLTGNHHDAEDLVQSALIKVVPKWGRIKAQPEGYVRQVLARESVNRWRLAGLLGLGGVAAAAWLIVRHRGRRSWS